MDFNGVITGDQSVNDFCDVSDGQARSEDLNGRDDNDSQNATPSRNGSVGSMSIEDRLKRIREAEQVKQQQRYLAYLEAQQHAELVRKSQQEKRQQKIEELRQKEQTRRRSALERRMALDQSNKLRMEKIRERSANRIPSSTSTKADRETSGGKWSIPNRTASASPFLGSAQHPSPRMTSSCVVAFGSSAPRSICTQPSPAALRLKRAFEARLASYLTGRHSGCFFTQTSAPFYACYLDPSDNSHALKHVNKLKSVGGGGGGAPSNKKRVNHPRRATSAHASILTKHREAECHSDQTSSVERPNGRLPITPRKGRKSTLNGHLNKKEQEDDRRSTQHSKGSALSRSSAYCPVVSESDSTRSNSAERNHRTPSVFVRLSSSMTRSVYENSTNHIDKKSSTIKPPVVKSTTMKKSGDRSRSNLPPIMTTSCIEDRKPEKIIQKPLKPIKSKAEPKFHDESPLSLQAELAQVVSNIPITPAEDVVSTNEVDESKESKPTLLMTGPIKAETQGSGDGGGLSEAEQAAYRAKLVEQRRLAKERMEEEQRRLEQEAKERQRQEEEARLQAESMLREQAERDQVEAEAERRRIEAEEARLEMEAEELRRCREIEERNRLQAAEAERIAKLQQAEEERVMRRRKLDSIMSRVKSVSGTPSATIKSDDTTSSPNHLSPEHRTISPMTEADSTVGVDESYANAIGAVADVPNADENATQEVSSTVTLADETVVGGYSKLLDEEVQSAMTNGGVGGGDDEQVLFSLEPQSASDGIVINNDALELSPEHTNVLPSEIKSDEENILSDVLVSTSESAVLTNTDESVPSENDDVSLSSIALTNNEQQTASNSETPKPPPISGLSHTSSSPLMTSLSRNNSVNLSNETPRFKSALLQSMLGGGGRLSTRAKDVVAERRSTLNSPSHLIENENVSSTKELTATDATPPLLDSPYHLINGNAENKQAPNLSHFNNSNGLQDSSSVSSFYSWPGSTDHEGSTTPSVRVETSTH